jgi:hypothetical protein
MDDSWFKSSDARSRLSSLEGQKKHSQNTIGHLTISFAVLWTKQYVNANQNITIIGVLFMLTKVE